ncbi:MAG: hypothetical protein N3D10_02240 [Candidatus Micrarchaeota archaeon]|nr:hypothetical protein [Candidatus Micrarchaeota archaeon]
MLKNIVFVALIFIHVLFAQSSPPPCFFNSLAVSISIAISIIVLLLLVGHLLNFQQLKFIALKEVESLAVLIFFLIFVLFSYNFISQKLSWIINFDPAGWGSRFSGDSIAEDVLKKMAAKGSNITIQQKAIVLVEENDRLLEILLKKAISFSESTAIEASKSSYITFYSTGFGTSTCSLYSIFRGPINLLFNALALGSFAIYFTKSILVVFGQSIICLLFPIGLFLAFFNLTRKAGIALISLCLSFYFIFPFSIALFTDYYNANYSKQDSILNQKTDLENVFPNLDLYLRNPNQNIPPNVNKNRWGVSIESYRCDPNYYNDSTIPDNVSSIMDILLSNLNKVLNFVIVKSIFIMLLSLSLTISFSSALAHALGLEIDLSILARLT